MATIRGRIVPESARGTLPVVLSTTSPAIEGGGDTDYACGNCGTVLVSHVGWGQIHGILIRCPRCAQHNVFPTAIGQLKSQVALDWITALIFLGGLIGLGTDFFRAGGGGVALVVAAAIVRYTVVVGATRALTQTSIYLLVALGALAVDLMALNLSVGMAGIAGTSWPWVVGAAFLLFCAVTSLLAVTQTMLLGLGAVSADHWRQRLQRQLMIPLVLALVAGGVVIGPLWVPLGMSSSVLLLVCCVLVAGVMLRNVPKDATLPVDPEVRPLIRRLLQWSPLWIVMGTAAEILRGNWTLWTATVVSIVLTMGWIHLVVNRGPANERQA
jgi:hypothetical protein